MRLSILENPLFVQYFFVARNLTPPKARAEGQSRSLACSPGWKRPFLGGVTLLTGSFHSTNPSVFAAMMKSFLCRP